jgi:sigma-B regulation protein RsbU (phosphoserine phosphatase)
LSQLAGGGPPVGILPGIQFEQWSMDIAPGDLLVVVSDGMTEVSNEQGEFWDELIVQEIVRSHGTGPIAQLPVVLCANADSFAAGTDQYDDMTIVAVQVL